MRFMTVAVALLTSAMSLAQEPTPTPQTSDNGKQHEWAKEGRRKGKGNKLGVGSPFLETTVKPGALLSLEEFACKSRAIVVGRAVAGESSTTADGSVIFTNYQFAVDETIRIAARPRARMEVTRIGGSVATDTGSRTFKSRTLPPLELGQTYLLFLSRVKGSPTAFAADVPGGTLRISDAGVEQIDGVSFVKGIPRRGISVATESLLGDVRIASRKCAARPGQARTKG